MSTSRGNHFVLYMFEKDLENMTNWVLQYPNRETGGDLFGLWSGVGDNAVIHVVLGPGRGCTHGDYYFYQDVNYLEKVGSLLTENYMLGHIGKWHSHHQLKLDRPSEGDCWTIQRNFPDGSCGFFLMIANIIDRDNVTFSPYIFKDKSGRCRAGYVEAIDGKGPFSRIRDISQKLEDRKEINAVAPRKELETVVGKQKSILGGIKDTVTSFIIPNNSTIVHGTYTTSTGVMQVKPLNSSFQWTSNWKESSEVIEIIYYGLRQRVGEIELAYDENRTNNLNMTFGYHNQEVSLSFPHMFPSRQARIMVNKKCLGYIYLNKCFTLQSFDLNEFLDVVFTLLKQIG